ncbi:major facilitator superfamily domain-containing protein [Ampelomyces quisqualis]|uniref:Major facilitator superfamily domain-containing protein n=1 Tax=Ampelomyces quisqualis TaxID=50730 RepID=A0A6A5QCM5_AMPQU|nr:major facilitator superfamily domain-containing protein [Ampelomyces quisqualis]
MLGDLIHIVVTVLEMGPYLCVVEYVTKEASSKVVNHVRNFRYKPLYLRFRSMYIRYRIVTVSHTVTAPPPGDMATQTALSSNENLNPENRQTQSLDDSKSEESSSPIPEKFEPGWRFIAAFVSLCVITLMAALDATSISVALPVMAKALGGSAIEAFWAGTSFLLTSTVFQPVLGSFSHIFGRKSLIYISLAFFLVGSIIPAVANNFNEILLGRSIQGVGGGGIISLTELVVVDTVPLRERGKWFSFFGAMWSVGTVAGPLLGGGFSQNVTWRWVFWINLPFLGLGLVLIATFLKLNQKHGEFLSKLREVDWIGMVLFLASTTGFLIPVSWGGVQYPWDSWCTLVPLLVSAAGLFAFVIHQEYLAPHPLIRTSVFKTKSAAILFVSTTIHGIILWAILYYMPLYFEAVKGMGPILAGVSMFPWTFTVAPGAVATGIVIAVTGKYRWANWIGWFFATLGVGLLIMLQPDTSTAAWIFLNLVGGIGTGMLFPAMELAVQSSATVKDQAYATNMFSFFRAFGQTLGVAIGGVVFQNQMKKKLLTFPLLVDMADEYSRDAAELVQIIKELPAGLVKEQLRASYTYALKYIWIVMTVLSAMSFFITLFIDEFDMNTEMDNERGFKDKDKMKDLDKQQH